jgi:hypothetical protein
VKDIEPVRESSDVKVNAEIDEVKGYGERAKKRHYSAEAIKVSSETESDEDL